MFFQRKDTLSPDYVCLLVLDSFHVHVIQFLGIEVQYNPGGYTYIFQLIDV